MKLHGENGKMLNNNFWKNKKVYLTGHTGFKGSWFSMLLYLLGAKVKGFALKPKGKNSLFNIIDIETKIISEFGDIRDFQHLKKSILEFQPDIVFHLAAQPLVIESYHNPLETYQTNVIGTLNLLEILRTCNSIKSIVNITTDKCYENKETIWGYRENDRLGGLDPYSNSKTCSEFISRTYYKSFFENKNIGLSTARAGNVIGGGDWGNHRLLPDILDSFSNNKLLKIRNPSSVRPWQHVLEPLSGYLVLAEKMYFKPKRYSESWNFGPKDCNFKSVIWILKEIEKFWKKGNWIIEKNINISETELLKLDISKSTSLLNWSPKWNINKTLDLTVNWHKSWLSSENMFDVCLLEIKKYFGENHE